MAANAIGKVVDAVRAKFPNGLASVDTLFISRGEKGPIGLKPVRTGCLPTPWSASLSMWDGYGRGLTRRWGGYFEGQFHYFCSFVILLLRNEAPRLVNDVR